MKQPKNIDNLIGNLLDALDFDAILRWARVLDVEIRFPVMTPIRMDWQDELIVEVGEAMLKISTKAKERD